MYFPYNVHYTIYAYVSIYNTNQVRIALYSPIQSYTTLYSHIQAYTGILKPILPYTSLYSPYSCIDWYGSYTTLHSPILSNIAYATLYQFIKAYTTLYSSTPVYKGIYNIIQPYINLYSPITTYTALYDTIKPYTSLYRPIRHYTTPYQSIQAYKTLSRPIPVYTALYNASRNLFWDHLAKNLINQAGKGSQAFAWNLHRGTVSRLQNSPFLRQKSENRFFPLFRLAARLLPRPVLPFHDRASKPAQKPRFSDFWRRKGLFCSLDSFGNIQD